MIIVSFQVLVLTLSLGLYMSVNVCESVWDLVANRFEVCVVGFCVVVEEEQQQHTDKPN